MFGGEYIMFLLRDMELIGNIFFVSIFELWVVIMFKM